MYNKPGRILKFHLRRVIPTTNADALSYVSSLVTEMGVTEEKRQQIADKETKATNSYENHNSPVGGHRGRIKPLWRYEKNDNGPT